MPSTMCHFRVLRRGSNATSSLGGRGMSATGSLRQGPPARRSIIGLLLALLLGLLWMAGARPAAAAGPCGPPVVSVTACENTLPGDPASDWQGSGAGDSTIQGFATSMDRNSRGTENLQIKHPRQAYHPHHPPI